MEEKESKFTPGREVVEVTDMQEIEVMPLAQAVKAELLSDSYKHRVLNLGETAHKAAEIETPENQ